MANQEIAAVFFDIAAYLEMDEVPFKPAAYRKAAFTIENYPRDVADIMAEEGKKGLMDIPGVGENLANKIEEYLQTGKVAAYEKYRKQVPVDLADLMKVEGLGPRRIRELYEKLGVRTIHDLERVIESHKVKDLFGFGERTEQNIREGVSFLKLGKRRLPLREILPKAEGMVAYLKKVPGVKMISLAGSVRRKKETIGDVDILAVADNAEKVTDAFTRMPGVYKVWAVGPTKASVGMKAGYDVDLRIVPEKSYGAALQYFTGSKDHNITMRKLAQEKGFKLNEYGLFRGDKMMAGKTEEEIYRVLGVPFPPPEQRT